MVVLRRMRRWNDVGEDAGRMGFHYVVLVGLLEALIAAKREQDYYYEPTVKPIGVGSFVDGVPFFFIYLIFNLLFFDLNFFDTCYIRLLIKFLYHFICFLYFR